MKSKSMIHILLLLFGVMILGIGCDYEAPVSLWDPDDEGTAPSATITSIVPDGEAGGGVNEIEIIGTNFNADMADNSVYFDNVKTDILSATSERLVVLRPDLVADDATVKVVVPGALLIARLSPYKVTGVVENFTERYTDTGNLRAFAIDADGNFYSIMRDKSVRRRAPGSIEEETIGNVSQRSIGRLRIGPDGDFYYIKENDLIMYHYSLEQGSDVAYAQFPKDVNVFDWDENGYAWVAGEESGLYVMKAANDIQMASDYSDFNCLAVRVYSGAVYVLALYTGTDISIPATAVWKNVITGDGTVSARELVLDWTKTAYAESVPFDIEFASDGAMYITNDDLELPVIKVAGGNVLPLYKGMLTGPATLIDWGNDNSLYFYSNVVTQADKNVFRLDMGKQGAPHYGR